MRGSVAGFAGGEGLDCQSVDASLQLVGQGRVDEPMPFDPRPAGKFGCDDGHAEMALAAVRGTGMAGMETCMVNLIEPG